MELELTYMPRPDALSLEYQTNYGLARRDLDVTVLINNPVANGKCSVLGFGLQKQFLDLFTADFGSIDKHVPNPHAVALGRLGGLRGGPARKKSLSPKRRREIAKKAAETRWSKA